MGTSDLIHLSSEIGLSRDEAWAAPSGGGGLNCHRLEVDPFEFLARAEDDFECGGEASEINAITNAKRAIVSQMDQALLSFGYPSTKWNFPKKLEILKNLGLVAPRILKKVNSARNLLEHEYRRAKRIEIEEALDLAALFVSAIKPILYSFPDQFSIGNSSECIDLSTFTRRLDFSMSMSDNPGAFCVRAFVGGKLIGETTINWKDDVFPVTTRLALASNHGFKLKVAIRDFCAAVCRPTSG